MANKKLIFLSDIHMGSNYETNWYQANVHEPYLTTALSYIQENKDIIEEFIILGDLFDQWTYPADYTPPTFKDIVEANPGIYGGEVKGEKIKGALIDTLTALEGRVTYLNGNHDMAVTPSDIALLTDGQYSIKTLDSLLYKPEAGKGKLICTHGHIFSLFNSPDFKNPPPEWDGLPLGYFMARLASQWVKNVIAKNPEYSSVADMPKSGNPSGFSFDEHALIGAIKSALSGHDHLSNLVMAAQLDAADYNPNSNINLPNNNYIKGSEVSEIYEKLLHTYPSVPGIPKEFYGVEPSLFALTGADVENSLVHFAKELAEEYRVVIMGHTHVPEEENEHFVFHGKCLYANSGFYCPSLPDMGLKGHQPKHLKHPTFVEVEIDNEKSMFNIVVNMIVKDGDTYTIKKDDSLPELSISMND